MPNTLRAILISLSLANLCFVERWKLLIYQNHYLLKNDPRMGVLAIFIGVLIWGALIFLAIQISRCKTNVYLDIIANCIISLPLLYPLNYIREFCGVRISTNYAALNTLIGLLATNTILVMLGICIVIFVFKKYVVMGKLAMQLGFLTIPFLVLCLTKAAWLEISINPKDYKDKSLIKSFQPTDTQKKRVVLVVFDELDQGLAYEDRPANVHLPEFDRLRAESFYASNAYPPAGKTILSMPALITGRMVHESIMSGPDQLLLHYRDSQETDKFSEQKNIFSDAQAMGHNTALIGWSQPYCRMLNSNLNFCSWQPYEYYTSDPNNGLLSEIYTQLSDAINFSSSRSFFVDSIRIKHHVKIYSDLLVDSLVAVGDCRFGLVLLHLPVPHAPYIYDPSAHKFTRSNNSKDDYFGNLALADLTLGKIRQSLERSDVSKKTILIVTSDHWLRVPPNIKGSHKVPFLCKLPLNVAGETYDKQFNTILIRKFIREALAGRIQNYEEIGKFIDVETIQ